MGWTQRWSTSSNPPLLLRSQLGLGVLVLTSLRRMETLGGNGVDRGSGSCTA